jgi:hypothetical protein
MPGECIHAEILIKDVDEFEIAFYINNVILISYWLSHVSRARRSQDSDDAAPGRRVENARSGD